ncbi:MAG: hypothetical protein LIP77_03440, partial [Planctomycetes bacterium]|nr:hypothetical protein [Planctomycetota bacterium]
MRKVFPVFAVVLGVFWVVMAFRYGLWVRRGPGGGFFPLIGGLITVVFSAIYLVMEIRRPTPASVDTRFCYPILAVLAVLIASRGIGLLPCLFLALVIWLWRSEGYWPVVAG